MNTQIKIKYKPNKRKENKVMKEQMKELTKSKFKFTKNNWKNPTPAMWRRIGEAVNMICMGIAASTYNNIPWVAATVFFVGLAARTLVEFFIAGE